MAPSNITIRRVEQPSDVMIEEAVQVFTDLMRTMNSGRPRYAFSGRGRPQAHASVACGLIKPLARISAPGRTLFDTKDQLAEGYADFLNLLPDDVKDYRAKVVESQWDPFTDRSLGIEEFKKSTYYCHLAFVRADYHGKGMARALFEIVFESVRKLGAVITLKTTDGANVIKYEKLGLEAKGQIVIRSPLGDWEGWSFLKDMKIDLHPAST